MQNRIRPSLLRDNAYGSSYPQPSEKVLDVTYLNGGLNLWELDYRLDANQSPDLLNVYWEDGSLSSRKGQAYVFDQSAEGATPYGTFYCCYERPWQGYMIAHKGTKLYKINYETGVHTEIYSGTLTESYGGSFFVFGDKLYYLLADTTGTLTDGGAYIQITQACVATDVVGYIPTVIVNRYHDGTGGSTYQDENRIQYSKKIQFTTGKVSGESTLPTTYNVPSAYCPIDNIAVICKLTSPSVINYNEKLEVSALPTENIVVGAYYKLTTDNTWHKYEGGVWVDVTTAPTNLFTVNRTTGVITFDTAPPEHLTQTPSNLDVTISKEDEEARKARSNILSCRCVTVYGGDTELAVVVGGPITQPNAYFWSGSTSTGLDPTYFPFDYYNYAGASSDEAIIAFGKQQKMLIIFKENSIGKSYFEIKEITTKDSDGNVLYTVSYLNLPYTPVNETIGCNIENSVRLIQNNLVFANTYGGVYTLLDTTAAGENSVKRISRNVNGENVLKESSYRVYTYANREAFPTVGTPGCYYKATNTNLFYIWSQDGNIYMETRLVPPASGLMYDLNYVSTTAITSYDDGKRYWLVANGKAYLWDYTLSNINSYEKNMCWFYFDNITPRGWFKTIDDGDFYFTSNGSIVKFTESFSDFGKTIPRRYVFATQYFKTYEVLKDVVKVIFAVRSDTDSAMTITYKTDYETRVDKTPIRAWRWRLSPRDLSHRSLAVIPFAGTAVRMPRCFHIRMFAMQLTNDTVSSDMSIISAQIVYRYSRGDR